MTPHLPILMVVFPLAGAVVAPLAGIASARGARPLSLGVLTLTHLSALGTLWQVLKTGTWRYELGGWAPPWGIEYVVDALGGGMAVLVSFMALMTAVYSGPERRGRRGLGAAAFHALHLLLTAGLLGIVVTGDAFNLYVFLEIAAISAYALLATGGERAPFAVFRYLLVGTVAASFYLLGVGYLYAATGTLNMADIAARLSQAPDTRMAGTALSLVVVGLAIKIGLFPLHGWLPDAYSYAPPPVASFVSSVMGKVGVYVLVRFLFYIFEAGAMTERVLALLAFTAALAIVAGSVMALIQRDLRRMLAYSGVGQIGYVILGVGLANTAALTGALLHLVNHAVLKACLFMACGNVLRRAGTAEIARYAGMARRLPLTMGAFVAAGVSMIGLPPAGGFFSKWYLVQGALERGAWPYVAVIAASSLLTAAYVFRVIESAYFRTGDSSGSARAEAANGPPPRPGEAPAARLAPVLILALAVLGLGIFNQALVDVVVSPILAGMRR